MLDSSKGAKPLYIQVRDQIDAWIKEGKWQPGELIPSELEFQNQFHVSRITVRQAIQELVNENILVRKSGVGTRVLQPIPENEKYSTVVKSAPNEMREIGHDLETRYSRLEELTGAKKLHDEFPAEDLLTKKLYQLDRVRGYQGKDVVYSETTLCIDAALTDSTFREGGSLYRTLKGFGLTAASVQERLTAGLAGKRVAGYLKLDKNDPILIRERRSYDKNGDLFEFTVCYYNPELYSYNVNVVLPQ